MSKIVEVVSRSISSRPVTLLLLLLLMIFITYSNSLFSPLILDDNESFMRSSEMLPPDFSLNSLKNLAATRFGMSRFVPLLTFAVNNKFSLGSLPHYHLTNIFIHLLVVTTIFFFIQGLLKRTTLQTRRSILPNTLITITVCGLWGLSPVQTNAVTYLVQRMTSLMALFYLLSMTFYLYGRTAKSRTTRITNYGLGAVSAILAFMSKENSATLPAALMLMECTIITPGSGSRLLARIRPRHWLYFAVILLIVLPIPLKILAEMVSGYGNRPFSCTERLLTESRVVVWYISLLLLPLPSRMNLDHDPILSRSLFSPPTTILSIILLGLIIWSAYRFRHKSALVTFGVFFFFLNLMIESTVVPLELVFEHRLYLPALGFFIALVGGIDLIFNRWHNRYGELLDYRPLWMGMVILLAISSIMTSLRNNDWRDELSLYADSMIKSPRKPRAYANYGMALGKAGRYREAIPVLEKSISLGSKFEEEYLSTANNLLNCLKATAGPESAVARGEQILKNIPIAANVASLPTLLITMGENYHAIGNSRLALSAFENALRNEQPGKNGYIFVFISALINDVYSKNGDGNAIDMSGFKDKNTAIVFIISKTLLEIREYGSTEKVLANVDPDSTNPDQAPLVELKKRLIDEQKRNRQVAEVTDISRDEFLNSNIKYLMAIKLSRLIIEHYPPLYFVADQLLQHLKVRNSTDPFVELYSIRLQLARKSPNVNLESLRRTFEVNPTFAPLLAIEAEQLLALNRNAEALVAIEKLLEIYPGTPDWQNWMTRIQVVRNSLLHGDKNDKR